MFDLRVEVLKSLERHLKGGTGDGGIYTGACPDAGEFAGTDLRHLVG
jgi:hypothetical protein